MDVTEAVALGEALLSEFGLNGWVIALDKRATRRFGQCRRRQHTIGLTEALVKLNTRAEVEDVIRHEIAHALVGDGHGHDRVWKLKCIEVGARPERCYDESVVTPPRRYTLTCPDCDWTCERDRRTRGNYKHHPRHGVLIWSDNRIRAAV